MIFRMVVMVQFPISFCACLRLRLFFTASHFPPVRSGSITSPILASTPLCSFASFDDIVRVDSMFPLSSRFRGRAKVNRSIKEGCG